MSTEDPIPPSGSASASASAVETLDQLQTRHRKEQRDLQSRVTQKKKNATKKTRKGVNDECATLERELKERQEREIALLNGEGGDGQQGEGEEEDGEQEEEEEDVNDLAQNLGNSTLSPSQPTTTTTTTSAANSTTQPKDPSATNNNNGGGGKKRNRQKDRLARRAAEVEAASAAAETEAAGMTDHRALEREYMDAQFRTHDLVEQDIQPDGHCLFSAVADQLSARGYGVATPSTSSTSTNPSSVSGGGDGQAEPGYKTTRAAATSYMSSHRDDFEPFLAMDERGAAGWDGYIDEMRNTATWGGQLELTALANAYDVEIRVVQDGRTESIAPTARGSGAGGEADSKRTIWLAYYRHGYGLGEHYNSLRPKA